MDARRTPKKILRAHLPDQRAQFCLDLRSPSPSTRFPTPIAAKAGPMPMHQRFGLDNRHDLQDRRKPAIKQNEEPAVSIRETTPPLSLRRRKNSLISSHCFLALSPTLRLEWRGQHSHNKIEQRDHHAK